MPFAAERWRRIIIKKNMACFRLNAAFHTARAVPCPAVARPSLYGAD